MTEPEYGTPEWHQHILDRLHDETGVQVHHDRMEFPGGHTFPVLRPIAYQSKENYLGTGGIVASEHLYPRMLTAVLSPKRGENLERDYSLNLIHLSSDPNNKNNNVEYSTKYPNPPNLLHPEQFGPEVQKRLRTVQDSEISENKKQELMEAHKERVRKHLNRNKKILFHGMDKNSNNRKYTLYDPHTGEVQHLHPDDWYNNYR
jgi:hypothetical protein